MAGTPHRIRVPDTVTRYPNQMCSYGCPAITGYCAREGLKRVNCIFQKVVLNIQKPEEETPRKGDSPCRTRLDRLFALDPLKITLIYLVFGILWIIFSDSLFLSLPARQEDLIRISSAKGIVFIIVTSAILFLLIRHFSGQLQDANRQLRARTDAYARSRAEWETTFNAISDWITLISPDGKILRSNKAAESLFGGTADEIMGRDCYELVHGTMCPVEGCPRERMLLSRKREIAEFPMRNGAGWIQVTVDPVIDSSGEVVSAVHIVRDITESMRSQKALEQAKKKLNLLNYVTFNDIQNMVFTITGYQQLAKKMVKDSPACRMIEKEDEVLQKISHSLKFAQSYQDLGLKPPKWQNATRVFLLAISHLDFLRIKHTVILDDLEIFADPLLEQVFQILADNVLVHGSTATQVTLSYARGPGSVILVFEDNSVGIPADTKTRVFSPDFQKQKGVGLFLAREILEITGISIRETGIHGKGARFEMVLPEGAYRFAGAGEK